MARFAMISDSPSPSLSLLSLPKEFCPGCSSMYSCSASARAASALCKLSLVACGSLSSLSLL